MATSNKNGRQGTIFIGTHLPPDLHTKFRVKCASRQRSMAKRIVELIEQDVKKK